MKYLDRDLIKGPFLALCRSEKEYLQEVKRLKIKDPPKWLSDHAAACVHSFHDTQGFLLCIVSVCKFKGYSAPEINSILCHEAVHVWQAHEKQMGELNTSEEFEAYSIQAIAKKLMDAYWKVKPYQRPTKPN